MEHNSKEYYELQLDFWFNECCKRMKERDELINDMKDVKRKAEAFDEVLNVNKFQHEEEYADEVLEIINKYQEEHND